MSDPNALQAVLNRTGDPAMVAWAHEGQGDLTRLADPALAVLAAEKLGNVAALQSVAGPKDLRKAAAASLHRIKSRGIKVQEKIAPRAASLGKERVELPSRSFLSLPDQEGDIELLVTASDDQGNCVLGMILGPDGSVREANHAHVNRSELRDLWKRAEERADHAELPFVTGLHYAERWLGNTHHDWRHFSEHVPPGTLASARLLDPLARAPTAQADDGDTDWNMPPRLLDEGALNVGVGRLMEQIGSAIEVPMEERNARMDAVVMETADAAVTPRTRPAMARAAELAAVTFRFHHRVRTAERLAEVARRLEAGLPGREIDAVVHSARLALVVEATGRMYREPKG